MIIQTINLILLVLLIFSAVGFFLYLKGREKNRQQEENDHKNKLRKIEKEHYDRLRESLHQKEALMMEEVNQKKEKLLVEIMDLRAGMYSELSEERKSFAEKNLKEMQENLKQHEANLQMSKEQLEKDFNQEKNRINQESHELQSAAKLLEDKLMNEQASINQIIADMLKMRKSGDLGRIIVSEIDLKEIHEINSAIKYFRNPIVLKKAIFEAYYRNPVREMINLITGGERISGIYKITNVLTDQCYIGQSVNIGDRWLNHIKRGVGAEAPTNSLLYPEMLEHGIENFRFEILEITDDLSAREKFYGEVYAAKTIGYNIRIG